ncbi:MAG: helix-turn-helix domain-containing protein [Spirochaetia bacterium]
MTHGIALIETASFMQRMVAFSQHLFYDIGKYYETNGLTGNMNIFAFFATVAFTLSAVLTGYLFFVPGSTTLLRVFKIVCFFLCWWLLSSIFTYSAVTKESFSFWFKLSFPGYFLFYGALLHFCLYLLQKKQPPGHVLIVIYGISVISAAISMLPDNGYTEAFIRVNTTWLFEHPRDNFRFYMAVLYTNFYLLISGIILLLWSKKNIHKKNKFSARIITGILWCIIILSTIEGAVLPELTDYRSRGILPLLFAFWVIGIGAIIIKNNFLWLASPYLQKRIIDNLEQLLLCFDKSGVLTSTNPKTGEILGLLPDNYTNYRIDDIFSIADYIQKGIDHLLSKRISTFSANLSSTVKVGLEIEAVFRPLLNEYEQPIGLLITGNQHAQKTDFADNFNLTPREQEVIHEILTGKSNKKIAEKLYISETTVKTHISKIFKKCNVKNRVQLINSLKRLQKSPVDIEGNTMLL